MTKNKVSQLYRIVTATEWQQALSSGKIPLNNFDIQSGFVHLSTSKQVHKSLELHFSKKDNPVVLVIQSECIKDQLKWEKVEARGGDFFPHLYRPINITDINKTLLVKWINDKPFIEND